MSLPQAVLAGLIGLIITPGQMFYFDVAPKVAVLLVGTAALLAGSARQPSIPHPYAFWVWLAASLVSLGVPAVFSPNRAISVFGSTCQAPFAGLVAPGEFQFNVAFRLPRRTAITRSPQRTTALRRIPACS
jgi:hypothetical protein